MNLIKYEIYLSFIFFISYSKSKDEKVEFNVEKIELPQLACIPYLGSYLFYLKGKFNKSPIITNEIIFMLESTNSKVVCHPLENTIISNDQLQCELNICDNPINNKNLFLPVNPPNIDGYIFPNWKQVIGENPGKSNKIPEDNINCTAKELNSYNISDIKSQGCSNKQNIILIDGKWSDDAKLKPGKFGIKLANNKANCRVINQNQIQCEIDGYGDVKFEEKYFKSGINVFKIEESYSSIHVDKCEYSSFLLVNKIILFFIIILF